MKTISPAKNRLAIAILLVVSFLFASSAPFAMPLMDECAAQTVCEKCCLISVPVVSGLQCEYSFSACPGDFAVDRPNPAPLPFDHPPQ
jgi:hypothetical protein